MYQYSKQNAFRLMDTERLVTGLKDDSTLKNCTGKKLHDIKIEYKKYKDKTMENKREFSKEN